MSSPQLHTVHALLEALVISGSLEADAVVEIQRDSGESLRGCLQTLERLQISEAQAFETLARHLGLEFAATDERLNVERSLVKRLGRSYLEDQQLVPLETTGDAVRMALCTVEAQVTLREVSLCVSKPVDAVMVTPSVYHRLVERMKVGLSMGGPRPEPRAAERVEPKTHQESSAEKCLRLIFGLARESHASDIHMEPTPQGLRVRFRVDGLLREEPGLTCEKLAPMRDELIAIVKERSGLRLDERRLPQDGRFSLVTRKDQAADCDVRVSTLPVVPGPGERKESVVMRLLSQKREIVMGNLFEHSPHLIRPLEGILEHENGIFLVTGPTGSGKTTTLYAALAHLNNVERKIITVEDPVEYHMVGITQVQTQPDIGLSFATALRSILRQDPDVVMIGEIRDLETATIAIQAALTGHLVLSTLHTNDAALATSRLLDMGVAGFQLAACLRGVLAQRLVRRLCDCAREVRPRPPRPEELEAFSGSSAPPASLLDGRGCGLCSHTGFRGRLGVYELLVCTESIGRMILEGRPAIDIKREAVRAGMVTLREDSLDKIRQGLTTLSEISVVD